MTQEDGETIFKRAEPYMRELSAGSPPASTSFVIGVMDRESLVGNALALRPPGMLIGWGDPRSRAGRYEFRAFGACQKDLGNGGELLIRFGYLLGLDLFKIEDQAKFIRMHIASSDRLISAAFKDLPPDKAMEAALCAYNTSIGAVIYSLHKGLDPNLRTYGRDYGKDVMLRARLVRPFVENWYVSHATDLAAPVSPSSIDRTG